MKTLIFTLLGLLIAGQARAAEGQPPKQSAAMMRETLNVQNQSAKTNELIALSKIQFKKRIGDVERVLGEYVFSKRSIRERENQIREYLRLASLAIDADDDLVSDEYLYQAYLEYRSDFESVMRDISLNRYRDETLTAADIAKIRNSLNDQKSGPVGQDDPFKKNSK